MANTNLTLADMLLEQAENLTNDKLKGNALKEQVAKAQALSSVAEQIVNLKAVQVKELDVNVKAAQTFHKLGYKFTPENVKLEALPPSERESGITPEGLPYEW